MARSVLKAYVFLRNIGVYFAGRRGAVPYDIWNKMQYRLIMSIVCLSGIGRPVEREWYFALQSDIVCSANSGIQEGVEGKRRSKNHPFFLYNSFRHAVARHLPRWGRLITGVYRNNELTLDTARAISTSKFLHFINRDTVIVSFDGMF